MSDNIVMFPTSDCELEWSEKRFDPIKLDASRAEVEMGLCDVSELRARAKLKIDDAIAALEQGHCRLREVAQVLKDPFVKAKLQNDLGLLEEQLGRAKLSLSRLWFRRG